MGIIGEFWAKTNTREGVLNAPFACVCVVGRGGFEPPKSKTSDLQSDPFGRSGIFPYIKLLIVGGAGDRN